MPDWSIHPRSITVALVAFPIVASISYIYRLNKTIQETTSIPQAGRRSAAAAPRETTSSTEPGDPASLPAYVKTDPSRWVVCYERVSSKPVIPSSSSSLADATQKEESPTTLFRAYLRATHVAFSWTPQAFLLRAMIKDPQGKETYNTSYINNLSFALGDVVNGLYRVSHYDRGGAKGHAERIELLIDPPASFTGPDVKGLLVAAVEPAGNGEVVFVNETWLWRAVDEPKTLLESPAGSWFHKKLAGWLVVKGIDGISRYEG